MEEFRIGGRTCRLFGSDAPSCILVQPSARHENATLAAEAGRLAELSAVPFVLATVELADWTLDLMPWRDGNISRDPEAGIHAQETLAYVLTALMPELRERVGPLPAILGGYSLGGLFALWASTQTDTFRAVAAASPSVWIRDWVPSPCGTRPSPASGTVSGRSTGCCRSSSGQSTAPWLGNPATTLPTTKGGSPAPSPGASGSFDP